jgi:hypothetical protein
MLTNSSGNDISKWVMVDVYEEVFGREVIFIITLE